MIIRQIIETSGKPSIELQKLSEAGLLKEIFPELSDLDSVMESPSGALHKNNFYHTLQVLDNVVNSGGTEILRWAAVLHDIGKSRCQMPDPQTGTWTFWNHNIIGSKMVKPILTRYQVPKEWHEPIKTLVFLHMRPVALIEESVTDSAVRRLITEAGPLLSDLMVLAEADITSRNRDKYLGNLLKVRDMIKNIIELDAWTNLNPVLNGNWIMDNYELHDPSEIGILKDHLKYAIRDHGVKNTKKDLLPLFKEKAKELGICKKKKKDTTTTSSNTGKSENPST